MIFSTISQDHDCDEKEDCEVMFMIIMMIGLDPYILHHVFMARMLILMLTLMLMLMLVLMFMLMLIWPIWQFCHQIICLYLNIS